ncbi:MAG: hypothetical protein K2K70_11400 [Lachnospiraceae bacterium]|nr:hypothetical protein [Lachnospiraceae bacterium]
MAKPIIRSITPFDSNYDYEISISWTGNRAYANRIIIYDYETNTEVFNDLTSSFVLKHTIPAHTLTNDEKYIIQAQIYDINNTPSALSDKVLFYTFTTPDFCFEDLPENSIITNSSFTANIHYYSPDWENISKYKFYLYDASKKQLLESNELTDDRSINYTYNGLDNNTTYYIRCVGVTVNGMALDTGYIEITVKFENPNVYARIYATPVPSQGCIQVATNLRIIQYNGTDTFEYIDGMIDLRDKTLYYDEGFLIEDDFTVIIRGMNLWQNAEIFKMSNGNLGLTLSSHIYSGGKLRFRLLVPNGVSNYLLYSDEQIFTNDDMVTVAIRRKNNVYQLKVFVELGFTTEGDMWYGTERPSQELINNNDSWINTEGDTYVVRKDDCITYLDIPEPLNAVLNDLWLGGD